MRVLLLRRILLRGILLRRILLGRILLGRITSLSIWWWLILSVICHLIMLTYEYHVYLASNPLNDSSKRILPSVGNDKEIKGTKT